MPILSYKVISSTLIPYYLFVTLFFLTVKILLAESYDIEPNNPSIFKDTEWAGLSSLVLGRVHVYFVFLVSDGSMMMGSQVG